MIRKLIIIIAINTALAILSANVVSAYWIWTPESKKFINPKYAVKDSPKEQFEWAMSFYDSKDYQRSAAEFEKLVKNYEYSEFASKSQYYVGLSYENMGKYYIAFQNYQKAIDNFPHIGNIDEILEKEFDIANLYMAKDNPKIMGMDILTSADRAAEIYRKIVENAPFGKLADKAQFGLGEALKKTESYEEAIEAFQKMLDNYPTSDLMERAKYEVAYCAYMASLKPAYASEPTDRAIKSFEEFVESNKNEGLSQEADKTIQRLKDKMAQKSFETAKFYESEKRYEAAILYYKDVVDRFPESSFALTAKAKIEELSAKSKSDSSGEKKRVSPWKWPKLKLFSR